MVFSYTRDEFHRNISRDGFIEGERWCQIKPEHWGIKTRWTYHISDFGRVLFNLDVIMTPYIHKYEQVYIGGQATICPSSS